MKVVHVPFTWWPDVCGGTEVYVARLSRDLKRLGIESVVCAPGAPTTDGYIHDVRVRRFPHGTDGAGLSAIYGGDPVAAEHFDRLLLEERPDVVHQHAFSPACSAELAARARGRGVPVVFTYHTPTASCLRGTLLKWGRERCDGQLETTACTACALEHHGVARPVGSWLALVPPAVGRTMSSLHLAGGIWTGLRMSSLTSEYHGQVRRLLTVVDRVVALTPWVEEVLVANGVPPARIVRSPHGVAGRERPVRATRAADEGLRLVHLGRLDPVKGTRVLLDALARIPDAQLTLDIFGLAAGEAGASARHLQAAMASEDPRVQWLPPVDHSAVIDLLATYDGVLVPSQSMETGPLVVLEAFAAGTPVIGSDLGGIADKVVNGRTGIIVRPFGDVNAWATALDEAARRPAHLRALTANVVPPRASKDVAREMAALYASLTATRQTAVG